MRRADAALQYSAIELLHAGREHPVDDHIGGVGDPSGVAAMMVMLSPGATFSACARPTPNRTSLSCSLAATAARFAPPRSFVLEAHPAFTTRLDGQTDE